MKNLYQIKRKRSKAGFTGLLLAMVVTVISCVTLDSVVYESTLTAGEEATFTVNMSIDAVAVDGNISTRLIFSFLAPKSWNAAANTTVTYIDTYSPGVVKTMSLIPAETAPSSKQGMTWAAALRAEYGVGPNVLDDMEWVTYQSNETYSVGNGDKQSAAIKVVTKVGTDNIRVKLGFYVDHSDNGLGGNVNNNASHAVFYTDCIKVLNGEGDLIDFCEPHFNLVVPVNATKNDILSIKFQGDIRPNDLDGIDEIYLVAKATTNFNSEYEISEKSAKTRMVHESGKTYSVTCWAADYFGIPENEEIIRIKYYFTNSDDSMSVTPEDEEAGTGTWFTKTVICK
ncbi:MAG: DUF4961 domain-containing protein [Dysgonamonadaceae bacterium]|jgi:hypothetical protein|nr:DUF4961 domain-containing protein [Dysgonamonadaceae bacterium]